MSQNYCTHFCFWLLLHKIFLNAEIRSDSCCAKYNSISGYFYKDFYETRFRWIIETPQIKKNLQITILLRVLSYLLFQISTSTNMIAAAFPGTRYILLPLRTQTRLQCTLSLASNYKNLPIIRKSWATPYVNSIVTRNQQYRGIRSLGKVQGKNLFRLLLLC